MKHIEEVVICGRRFTVLKPNQIGLFCVAVPGAGAFAVDLEVDHLLDADFLRQKIHDQISGIGTLLSFGLRYRCGYADLIHVIQSRGYVLELRTPGSPALPTMQTATEVAPNADGTVRLVKVRRRAA